MIHFAYSMDYILETSAISSIVVYWTNMNEKRNIWIYTCTNCKFRVYVIEITGFILNRKRLMEWQSFYFFLYMYFFL
jgi:hypothetical protein